MNWFGLSLDEVTAIIQELFLLFSSNFYQASFFGGNTN